jgi:hypothetical protein
MVIRKNSMKNNPELLYQEHTKRIWGDKKYIIPW